MTEDQQSLTMSDLVDKVNNYRNFATQETNPDNVFKSAVFHKDDIDQIFANAPGATGVRIYPIKHSGSEASDDVSYLMVPVAKTDEGFEDQIHDEHPLMRSLTMMARAEPCVGPLCK